VTPDFLGYMLASNHFVDQVIARSVGVSYPAINASELVRIPVPVPPPSEQLAIARFLDRETSKIDALVDEQHRLIELLNEKRQAITSRAVTKGLSPNAPMKPSGIEWLGDVPAHWDVLPFRRVTTRVDVGVAEAATHAYVDQGIPMVRSTNIKFQFVDTSDLLFLDKTFADRLRSKRIRSGDILTTRTGANLGVSAVVPPSLDSAQCFTLLVSTVATDCDPNFYNLFINGDPGRVHFARTAWGASQPNIDVPTLKEMPCVRPPLPEQQAIVRFVQDRTMHLDDLKNDACRAIQLLGERRVTVVSAAVTGQIGVRSATELEPA
jgi:type I restriction enzyme S subunit